MSEKRTTVVVEAQTKGLDKAARETRGVRDSMRELGEASKAFEGLEKSLAKVLKEFKSVVDTARSFSREIRNANSEMDKAKRRPSGFAMGVAQGSGMGEYFPSDMRLMPNLAGRQVGGMMRGGVAAAGSVFTGLQGVQTGLSSLPGGGFLASQFGNAAATAEAALAYQQAQAGTMMFGGRATRLLAKGEPEHLEFPPGGPRGTQQDFDAAGDRVLQIDGRAGGRGRVGFLQGVIQKALGTDEDTIRDAVVQEVIKKHQADSVGGKVVKATKDQVQLSTLDRLSGTGTPFGMDMMATRGFLGSMLQASGGNADQLSGSKAQQAMAASTRFGLGADVSGVFARGERMGAGGGMMEAIRSGMSLALEGSDLTNFTRQTAQAMMSFEQTGMPLSISGVRDMTAALSGNGFGRERSVAVGQGLLSAGRRIAQGGVNNAADFTMLRDFYGFQGGGTEDYFAAIKKAESGQFDPKGLDKRIDVVKGNFDTTTAKGSASAALSIRNYLQTLGVQIGAGEAEKLISGDAGARAKIEAELKGAGQRAAGFSADDLLAQGTVGAGMQRQAANANKRVAAGQDILETVQAFEGAQVNATKAAAALAKELEGFARTVKEISSKLPQDTASWNGLGDLINQVLANL
jgi:hypothetical protein